MMQVLPDKRESYIKTVNILFAAGLFPLVSQYASAYVFSALRSAFPDFFSQNPFWSQFFLSNVFYMLLYTSLFLLVAKVAFGINPARLFESKPVKPAATVSYVFMFLGASLVLSFLWNLIQALIDSLSGTESVADYTQLFSTPSGFLQTVAFFFLTALLPAVCEELCLRAFFCGELSKYSDAAAIVLSALMFALMHFTFGQMPTAFLLGLLLAAVYVKTHSFSLVFLMHFINNLWSAFLMISAKCLPEQTVTVIALCGEFVILSGGLFFWILFLKNRNKSVKLKAQKTTLKYTLCSPMLWITAAVCLTYTFIFNYALLG